MRDHLWYLTTAIRYKEYYCRVYRQRYRAINRIIIWSCIGITIISLSLMTVLPNLGGLFAILGIFGQTMQVIIPNLLYSKRIESANYFILGARRLADYGENQWYLCKENDNNVSRVIDELNQSLTRLDNDCFLHEDLPRIALVEAKAVKEWEDYYTCFSEERKEVHTDAETDCEDTKTSH